MLRSEGSKAMHSSGGRTAGARALGQERGCVARFLRGRGTVGVRWDEARGDQRDQKLRRDLAHQESPEGKNKGKSPSCQFKEIQNLHVGCDIDLDMDFNQRFFSGGHAGDGMQSVPARCLQSRLLRTS